ncbi:hypothetical protein JKF63_04851 [Porcisia hertigi]|uniref:Uncharacterized protein n=1 Tax=Porcisia hertigi TaxID=2761500 RepID=A0A836IUX5_9TRYP|nr:hypothetical protein JKF63_04851 [Porcisia hertigi]
MLHCSLLLCRPGLPFFPSAPLLASRTGHNRSRTWSQPDIRQLRNTPTLHRLQGVLQLTQRNLPDPASHRQGHTYVSNAQGSLLSRPGGRASRLSDPCATFHYRRRTGRPPRVNTQAFRKYYNSS